MAPFLFARLPGRLTAQLLATLALTVAVMAAVLAEANRDSAPLALPISAPDYGNLPLTFEPSAGRFARVDYLARSASGTVSVGPGGIRFEQSYGTEKNPEAAAIAMSLPGATLADPRADGRLPGVVNDLRGDETAGQTDIPTFSSVHYADVWPSIDLALRGSAADPEYDFELAPGADPSRISLDIEGSDSARISPGGDLIIESGGAIFRQQAPLAYQPGAEGRSAVDAAFRLEGNSVSFALGSYDPSRRLVIDPVALAYSTYLGGSGYDTASAIAVDSAGAAYITGSTTSSDFDTVGPIEGRDAASDAFIAKLSPTGNALTYSTYLGGSSEDTPQAIAVDTTGAAYITGYTSSTDFNTVGAIEGDSGDALNDAFIAKLNPSGSALAYSTYLGGNANDAGAGIAVDSTGAAYIAGYTGSTDFDTVGQIEGDSAGGDAFTVKVNPAGNALVYSTYLGGTNDDEAKDIAVDSTGAAYVTGETFSTDFDTVAPIEGDGGDAHGDVFIAKLNPAGSALAYSTYLGGSGDDQGRGIAIDSAGSAYVTGVTGSTNFDTVGPIEGDSAPSYGNPFVAKLDPAGSALAYSTYLGGSFSDSANDIAVDSTGAAYITGSTNSTDFNTRGPIEADSANADAFVAKLNRTGSALAYATYLGGSGSDGANGIALDPSGAAYVTGSTNSTNFDTVGPIEGHNSDFDAFVSKLTAPDTNLLSGPAEGSTTGDATPAFTFSSDNPTADFECRIDGGPWEGCESPWTMPFLSDGPHVFRVRAIDDLGDVDLAAPARTFTVDATPPETHIDSGPAGPTNDSTPTFSFSASESGSTFECGVDGGAWSSCSSPKSLPSLADGTHTLEVRATDAGSHTDPSPAARAFTVDTAPPDVFFTSAPAGLINDPTPTFGFAMSEAGTLQCLVDGSEFAACTSPKTTPALADGPHTFTARATDAAGNRSSVARDILVDTTPPQTTLTPVPGKVTAKKAARLTFSFSSSEDGSSFACSLDGAPFAPCTSPVNARLKIGTHSFAVKATDKATNPDASPAQATVRVKKKRKK